MAGCIGRQRFRARVPARGRAACVPQRAPAARGKVLIRKQISINVCLVNA
jgi:hypothetical protein